MITLSQLTHTSCTNPSCHHQFDLSHKLRCPTCNEPANIPTIFAPTINTSSSSNIYRKYFQPALIEFLDRHSTIPLDLAQTIGNTPLTSHPMINQFTGLATIYLKNEGPNPSGSFKDRGTFTAYLISSLILSTYSHTTISTVSTGNMAISTAYFNRLINQHCHTNFKAHIIVGGKTTDSKIQAIRKAGDAKTTLFIIADEYSTIHDQVYQLTSLARQRNVGLYPQLTDDVFRIAGYTTLFAECIDQLTSLQKSPDVIIIPVASGALFRIAVFAIESLYQQGFLTKLPRIFLVQEEGGDPIVQAFNSHTYPCAPIELDIKLKADAINVSKSRSGNPALKILQHHHHFCISVTPEEIMDAVIQLISTSAYSVEPAAAASIAAAKKATALSHIQSTDTVVAILTGSHVVDRKLSPSAEQVPVHKVTLTKFNILMSKYEG